MTSPTDAAPASQKKASGSPASARVRLRLTVARDLAPLGYEVIVFDGRCQSRRHDPLADPRFRLPEE